MQIPDHAFAEYIKSVAQYAHDAEELERFATRFLDKIIKLQQVDGDKDNSRYWMIEIDAYAKNVRQLVNNGLKDQYGKKTKIFEYIHFASWNAYYLQLMNEGTIGLSASLKKAYEVHNSRMLNAHPEAMSILMDFITNWDDIHGLSLLRQDLKLKGFFRLPVDVDNILGETGCDTIELMQGYYSFNYSTQYFVEYVNLLAKRANISLTEKAKKQVADLIALR